MPSNSKSSTLDCKASRDVTSLQRRHSMGGSLSGIPQILKGLALRQTDDNLHPGGITGNHGSFTPISAGSSFSLPAMPTFGFHRTNHKHLLIDPTERSRPILSGSVTGDKNKIMSLKMPPDLHGAVIRSSESPEDMLTSALVRSFLEKVFQVSFLTLQPLQRAWHRNTRVPRICDEL